MFPWFAIGHLTQYLHFSNKFAERGHRITFLAPTKTQLKFIHLNHHPHLIKFILIDVHQVDGLPVGAETMSDVPLHIASLFAQAFDLTQEQLKVTLQNLKPDYIFFDLAYWVPSIARPLGIKSVYFSTVSVTSHSMINFPMNVDYMIDPPPDYPSSILSLKIPPYEARHILLMSCDFGNGISFLQRLNSSIDGCEALCFQGCRELEGPFSDFMEKKYKNPVLLLGPVLPKPSCNPLEEKWVKWLGGFEKGSVVYCAFGSECVLEKDQFQELVLGLELTGLPFIVRLKPPFGVDTVEEALPEGFEERTRGKGVVYGDWIQQERILSHPSVGCFVSHCGFGSMWESLVNTCQLVLVPHAGDQFSNTKLMTKELKAAVDVERKEEDGWFTKESLCNAVKLVMDEGSEVGEEVRANHLKWKEFLSTKGLESSYLDKFFIKLQNIYM